MMESRHRVRRVSKEMNALLGDFVRQYVRENYTKLLREPDGQLHHRFLVPGAGYEHDLWDWDSWLTDVAITHQIRQDGDAAEFLPYQQGCVRNFFDHIDGENGWIPIDIDGTTCLPPRTRSGQSNSAKPVLIQHALFVARTCGDAQWLEPLYPAMRLFLEYYENNCRHESGLYYFIDDTCIGVDNDPCTFFRPHRSSGSIFLNCLLYKELIAMRDVSVLLGHAAQATQYERRAEALAQAVRTHCYDERNGFFYSVDLNLLPIDPTQFLHSGCPRHWSTLLQRIDVWSGFLPLWAGIATPEQAQRTVTENYLNPRTFRCFAGVRTLSPYEKMYCITESSNPSCWLGPVWGVSNYLVFRGLLRYGYTALAEELAQKTVELFDRDIRENGAMHEYYHPDTGCGIAHLGFQSWNLLAGNMVSWLRGEETVFEE